MTATLMGSFNIGRDTKLGDINGDGQEDTVDDIFSDNSEGGADMSDNERYALEKVIANQLDNLANGLKGLEGDEVEIADLVEQLGQGGLQAMGGVKVDIYKVEGYSDEVMSVASALDKEEQKNLDKVILEVKQKQINVGTGKEIEVNEKKYGDGTITHD
jgi:hypothetical protein